MAAAKEVYGYELVNYSTSYGILVFKPGDNTPIPRGGGKTSAIYVKNFPGKYQGYWVYVAAAVKDLKDKYPGVENMQRRPTPEPAPPAANTTPAETRRVQTLDPTDLRLVFATGSDGQVVYSMSGDPKNAHLLVDGMQFSEGTDEASAKTAPKKMENEFTVEQLDAKAGEFKGVPALLNPNSYINLQAAGGRINNKYLIDRENSIRFYNVSEPGYGDGSGVQPSSAPTVNEIVAWSRSNESNTAKFPYKFTDFAFLKWWKKIPNNYLITLRRYPFPVNDSVTSGEEGRKSVDLSKLKPVATMLTFLGEDTGNKISTILGPIETGLKWKDFTASVWEVTTSGDAASVNNPAPGLAKMLGFLATGDASGKSATVTPPDPYNNGPYANKIIGPVNVIETTKGREKGLKFEHKMDLVFEYSLRGIGGINTKAAGLDIIANAMLMTSATAPFWGGQNRYMPHAGFGQGDPFLGGAEGRSAWLRGDPAGFMGSLKEQFMSIGDNLSDLFNKFFSGDGLTLEGIAGGASDAAKLFMKNSVTQSTMVTTGIHSLLTGAPVGEWHVCVGSPMNPMMMMGNMICTNAKIEFSDELGPDDFPAEIKVTITIEHGMPRDKAGIESMFNKGRGRIYALPKGYEQSLASSSQSPVDTSITPRYKYLHNDNTGASKEADGKTADQKQADKTNAGATNTAPTVSSVFGALYSQGSGYSPAVPKPDAKK
jgi:hypothetical protein